MSGQDIELRFEVENSENVKIVEDVFHIYKYENDLTNEEILQRKNQFKELTGKTPLFFEFTQPEEMSVTELTIKGSSLQIKFDENIHSIQVRPGESTRCEYYCDVKDYCQQYKRMHEEL